MRKQYILDFVRQSVKLFRFIFFEMMKLPIKTYAEAMKYIFKKELVSGGKYSRDNIFRAKVLLWSPDEAHKIIHIAWTNGKWSVTKMVFSILEKAGEKVCCFTSPHLIDIRERIMDTDGMISKKDFVRYLNKILVLGIHLSYFELCVLIAFLYFKDKGCEYVVLEVGLWWLSDATNIITPVISCITNISLDHQNVLWNTVREISLQKAGIIKEWIPVVLGEKNAVIEKVAKQLHAPIIFAFEEKKTNLLGAHQRKNAGIAYAICKRLGIAEKIITQWLLTVSHPGRLQFLSSNLCIDGAHNIAGLQTLKSYLKTIEKKYQNIVYCFSLKEGKDPSELILSTFGRKKEYIIVRASSYQLEKSNILAKKMQWVAYDIQTPQQIMQLSKKNPYTLYIVFWSLYMIGSFIS